MIKEHRLEELYIISGSRRPKRVRKLLAPGSHVGLRNRPGCLGLVIARVKERVSILWSQWTEAIKDFTKFAFPIVRRTFAPAIMSQIVQVQPMTVPSSLVFYLDYQYKNSDTDDT